MTKYADKYPNPGRRPPEEGSMGDSTTGFDDMYRAYRGRAETMTKWREDMRKHAVARAIDQSIEGWESLAADVGSLEEVLKGAAHGLGLVVVWLAFLGEPLPPELFP
jgi:hypothetical protein